MIKIEEIKGSIYTETGYKLRGNSKDELKENIKRIYSTLFEELKTEKKFYLRKIKELK